MGKLSALRLLAIAALSFTGAAAAETVARQWATQINGTASSSTDTHNAVTVDAAGDVYSCGAVQNSGTFYDFHVVKYSGTTGAVLWSYTRHGSRSTASSTFDQARSIAVGPDGSIYAAGTVDAFVAGTMFTDIYLVKLNPVAGGVIWENGWGTTALDNMSDMAVDSAGNVVITAFLQTPPAAQTVLKVSSAGSLLWTTKIKDKMGGNASNSVNLQRVAVDSEDNIFIGGMASFWGAGYELYLTKLGSASGTRLWEWHGGYAGTSNGSGTGELKVNSDGDVLFNGTWFGGYGHLGGSGNDSLTVKINGSTGAEFWRSTYDYGVGGSEYEGAVAQDPNGDVYVTGGSNLSYSGSNSQIFTRKINGTTGEAMWTQRHVGDASASFGRDIAVTAQGDVLTLGFGRNARLFKYTGANGTLKWEATYGTGGSGVTRVADTCRTLVLRPDGSAVVCAQADANWATVVFAPAPDTDGDGTPDATDPDDDNDGLPDAWELANGFNPLLAADADADADGDAQPNSAEYIAGTDPRDRNSALLATMAAPPAPGSIALSFPAIAGRSYTARYRTGPGSAWTPLQHFPAQPVSGPLTVVDTPPPGANRRFYEVVTPQQQ